MSNPGGINLNINPYYDDYDEDKKFARVLYRPGRAVQARELNQSQAIQQKQIERMSKFFFKQGSIVEGCEQSLDLNLPYVKLQSTYTPLNATEAIEVEPTNFLLKEIYGYNSGVSAYVGLSADLEGVDPKTLFINYVSAGAVRVQVDDLRTADMNIGEQVEFLSTGATGTLKAFDVNPLDGLYYIWISNVNGTLPSGLNPSDPNHLIIRHTLIDNTTFEMNIVADENDVLDIYDSSDSTIFENDELIFTQDYTTRFYAQTFELDATQYVVDRGLETERVFNRGSKVIIGSGIMYIADHFIKNDSQTIILDKYTNSPSYRVGLVPKKTFISSTDDGSLVDNAQGTPNFQAPGADRLKIETVLSKVGLEETTDETEFVSMIVVENGTVKKRKTIELEGKIEEAIAKRTFDESGNYTLSDPKVSIREHLANDDNNGRFDAQDGGDADLLLLEVDPFTSYVKGYRNETISKTEVSVRKGLDTQEIEQVNTQINLGSYIVVQEFTGFFNIERSSVIELYDTPQLAISQARFGEDVNTPLNGLDSADLLGNKIGEARIKSVEYVSGNHGQADAKFNLYIYDIRMNSGALFQDVKSVFLADSSNTNAAADCVLDSFGRTILSEPSFDRLLFKLPYDNIKTLRNAEGQLESGFRFRREFTVTIGAGGSGTVTSEDSRETFVGTGELSRLQKNTNYMIIPKTTTDNIDLLNSSGTANVSASIDNNTDTLTVANLDGIFTVQLRAGDFIKIGTEYHIVASVPDNNTIQITKNYTGGSTYTGSIYKVFPAGVPIRLSDFGITGSSRSLNVTTPTSITIQLDEPGLQNVSVNFIATMDRSNAREITKSKIRNAQMRIVPETHPNAYSGTYCLGYSDIYRIVSITETFEEDLVASISNVSGDGTNVTYTTTAAHGFTQGETVTVENASAYNLTDVVINSLTDTTFTVTSSVTSAAPDLSTATATSADTRVFDVTGNYTLDNGQRDNTYENGSIVAKVGVSPSNKATLTVVFDYFEWSTTQGIGYVSIDSYPVDDNASNNTGATIFTTDIPIYTSNKTGEKYDLRGVLDFRPKKINTTSTENPTATTIFLAATTSSGLHLPVPNSDFECDLQYYKGRIDRLYVNYKGELKILEGSPGYPDPVEPPNVPETINLALLSIPPFPSAPRDVDIFLFKNKRFTMKEISGISDRVNRLEYYSSLNLLEQSARDKIVVDSQGNDRFKNGILVDAFGGHAVADVSIDEYKASISSEEKYATCYNDNSKQVSLEINTGNSQNAYVFSGNMITMPFSEKVFEDQRYASTPINLAQELTFSWAGDMVVYPATDNWLNTVRDPENDLVIDLTENSDNWKALTDAWNTVVAPLTSQWVGVSSTSSTTTVWGNTFSRDSRGRRTRERNRVTTTKTVLEEQIQRAVVNTEAQESNESVDRVTDVSVKHLMRRRDFVFEAAGLKEGSKMFAFFDGINVTTRCFQIELLNGHQISDLRFNNNGLLLPDAQKFKIVRPVLGDLRVDRGKVVGVFRVPHNTFYVGQREFKICDDSKNRSSFITTSAKFSIFATGLSVSKSTTSISTRKVSVDFDDPNYVQTINRRVETSRSVTQSTMVRWDPVAQSFYVDESSHPNGIYLTSIDIYFRKKSANRNLGASLQIREMQNGYPTRKIINGETVRKDNEDINVSENGSVSTTFTFSTPLYLLPGNEYCFVVKPDGNSTDFEIWTAVLGEIDITDETVNLRIDKQPTAGVLFTSSNDFTWSVRQNQDVKYRMKIAEFNPNQTTTVLFENVPIDQAESDYFADNIQTDDEEFSYSVLTVNLENLSVPDTNIQYEVQLMDNTYQYTSWLPIKNLERIKLTRPYFIANSANETAQGVKSLKVRATLTTTNKDISPIIDTQRMNVAFEKKVINNLTETDMTGLYTTTADSNIVNITGGAAFSEAIPGQYIKIGEEVRRISQVISDDQILMETNFTLDQTDVFAQKNLEIAPRLPYSSESRYISRRVELNDGFEASDLNVYLDVNRPSGTDIKVYYKILSENDTESFDDKFYHEMNLSGLPTFSDDDKTFIEEKFVIDPANFIQGSQILYGTVTGSSGTNSITGDGTRFTEELRIGDTIVMGTSKTTAVVSSVNSDTSLTLVNNLDVNVPAGSSIYKAINNVVGYTRPDLRDFTGFKYFAIKIVFLSNNEAIAPKVRNLRAIALA